MIAGLCGVAIFAAVVSGGSGLGVEVRVMRKSDTIMRGGLCLRW